MIQDPSGQSIAVGFADGIVRVLKILGKGYELVATLHTGILYCSMHSVLHFVSCAVLRHTVVRLNSMCC